MPVMSKVERAFCRSAPWRSFTGRIVLPWVLGNTQLRGEVLEIGSGAGANAQVLLERHPDMQLTATDLDPLMVASARRRLAPFGHRVTVTEADTTALPFEDDRFDAVVSLLMLHHVIDWRDALDEVARVVRPGGTLVGYDLTNRLTARAVHLADRSPHRLLDPDDLEAGLVAAGFTAVQVDTAALGTVARFSATTPAHVPRPASELRP
jgi:SAM-dependent methyltransferase